MRHRWVSLRLQARIAAGLITIAASLWLSSTPASAATGPNLALGRPVVASSVFASSFSAAYAVDGKLSTRWSSAFSDPQWLYVDLGTTHAINEVVLNWETAYGKAYKIQVSNDAVNWTTIYSTTSGTGGINDLTGLSGSGRYVRMYGTVRGTWWGYSLWEMSVYGPATDTTPPSTPGNLAGSAGNAQVSLSWSASSDPDSPVAGYYVFRNGSRITQTTATSYADAGLTNGTTYGYYVDAYDAAGNVSPASSTVSATPSAPIVTSSASTHIDTWALDDCEQGSAASASLVRQWVTFAETNCGPGSTKANVDCHANGVSYCKTLNYVDPNWQWSVGGLTYNAVSSAATSENWWLHQAGYTDSGHRLAPSCFGGVGYLIDQSTLAADQWFRDYVRANFGAWDGTFMDDTNGGMSQQFYTCASPSYPSSQEITSDSQLQSAHQLMANTMTNADGSGRFQVDNGEQANPNLAKVNTLLDNPASVHGLEDEGDPWDNGFGNFFSSLLDDMAYVNNHFPSGYFLLLHPYDSSGSAQGRRVSIATTLLGYTQGHTVLQEDMYNGVRTDLAVFPEAGIYPTAPVQSMTTPGGSGCEGGTGVICSTGGHNDLLVASGSNAHDAGAGVYRREFGSCYSQGVAIGPCAVIVNDTSSPVTVQGSWLTQSYSHQITFTGGDVQAGGTINLAGAGFTPGSTMIPADDAVLLAQ